MKIYNVVKPFLTVIVLPGYQAEDCELRCNTTICFSFFTPWSYFLLSISLLFTWSANTWTESCCKTKLIRTWFFTSFFMRIFQYFLTLYYVYYHTITCVHFQVNYQGVVSDAFREFSDGHPGLSIKIRKSWVWICYTIIMIISILLYAACRRGILEVITLGSLARLWKSLK